MKNIFTVIFVLIFAVSCGEKKKDGSDEDILSADNYEEIDSDTETATPECADEWEKTELIEDAQGLFDFKIAETDKEISWIEGGNYDSLYFNMSEESKIFDLVVSDEGKIFLLGDFYEGDEVYFLKAIENGEVKNFAFVTEETDFVYQIWERNYITPDMEFNKNRNSLDILAVTNSKEKEMLDSMKKAKSFIVSLENDGSFSFKTWFFESNNICNNMKIIDEKLHLSCSYSVDFRDWGIPSSYYASMQIVDGENVYRKKIVEEKNAWAQSLFLIDSKIFHYFVNVPVEMSSRFLLKGPVYNYGKDLCLKKFEEWDNLKVENFTPYGIEKISDDVTFYGDIKAVKSEGGVQEKSLFTGLFRKDDSELTVLGSKEFFSEYGEKKISNLNLYGSAFLTDGGLFAISGSTYDSENKGRTWGGMTDENFKPDPSWYNDPSITFINNNKEIFIRQMITPENQETYLLVFIKGDFVFVAGKGVSESSDTKVFVHRIPLKWLIGEEAKADDSRYWIEKIYDEITEIGKISFLSSGSESACVVDDSGYVFCWGDNSSGQLGTEEGENNEFGITSAVPVPVDVSGDIGGKKITELSSGNGHACAVEESGKVYCWGDNQYGQLGLAGEGLCFYPVFLESLENEKITKLSAGESFSCAVNEKGVVFCWGINLSGQLGDGAGVQDRNTPEPIEMSGILNGKLIKDVSGGFKHACSVADDGGVYCWGGNLYGQLGDGNGGENGEDLGPVSRIPVKAEFGEIKIKEISSGHYHTCALSEDGAVYCFGNNSKGQLGDGTTEMRLIPVKVDSDKVFESVSAGFEHSCAVDDAGTAYCWGSNITGQLGNGTKEDSFTPVKVAFDEGIKIKSVSCGNRHTCALDEEGKVYCWGWNNSGQLGNGTYDDSGLPVEIKVKE